MARTIPSPTSGRTIPTPAATPGGGGGNPWVDWETLSLDSTDSFWTLYKHSNAATMTAGMNGANLRLNSPANAANVKFEGTDPKGMALISSQPVAFFGNSGVPPEAESAHDWVQEATTMKLEVQLDPITGVSANGYGYQICVISGFVVYTSDQNGSPGQPQYWVGGRVWKNNTADPAVISNNNQYKIGYAKQGGQGDASASWRWKGTAGDGPLSSDCVVGEMVSGLAQQTVTSTSYFRGGVYRSDASEFINSRFFSTVRSVAGDSFTGNRWVHAFIGFGRKNSGSGTTEGWADISRIRLAVQPLASRAVFPGV